jgi:hypothetical protein
MVRGGVGENAHDKNFRPESLIDTPEQFFGG